MNSGQRFLQVTRAEAFSISWHALSRIAQYAGQHISEEEAYRLFCRGKQLTAGEVLRLGYRPAYYGRRRMGEQSWYFRFLLDGREFIAVIGEGWEPDEYVWVTTYARNHQTDHYRTATFQQLTLDALLN